MRRTAAVFFLTAALAVASCSGPDQGQAQGSSEMEALVAQYTRVRLEADLGGLTENQRRLLPLVSENRDLQLELRRLDLFGREQLRRPLPTFELAAGAVDLHLGAAQGGLQGLETRLVLAQTMLAVE